MENQIDLTPLIFSLQMQMVPCILTQVELSLDHRTTPYYILCLPTLQTWVKQRRANVFMELYCLCWKNAAKATLLSCIFAIFHCLLFSVILIEFLSTVCDVVSSSAILWFNIFFSSTLNYTRLLSTNGTIKSVVSLWHWNLAKTRGGRLQNL